MLTDTINTKTNWAEILTGEVLLFGLLGRLLYGYPDEEQRAWIQNLLDDEVFVEAPFGTDHHDVVSGIEHIQSWIQACGGKVTNEVYEGLEQDYIKLFVGPGKMLAAPWESVYFDEDRLLFQERTLEVRSWYKRFGLEAENIYREPDDHIGLELLFLSHLATQCIRALAEEEDLRFEELLSAQREFMKKHLGAWALTWCSLVEKHAQTHFFHGLAHLTRGAVFALSEVLNIKPSEEAVR